MLKRVGINFSLNTSIHGPYHIYHSKKPWNFVWVIIFLFMAFLTTWSTTVFVMKYLEYNVKTTITIIDAVETTTTNLQLDKMDFPSITFCPSYTVVKSEAKTSQMAIASDSLTKSHSLEEALHFLSVVSISVTTVVVNVHSIRKGASLTCCIAQPLTVYTYLLCGLFAFLFFTICRSTLEQTARSWCEKYQHKFS